MKDSKATKTTGNIAYYIKVEAGSISKVIDLQMQILT